MTLEVSCPFEDEREGAIGKLRHAQHDGRIRELEASLRRYREAVKRLRKRNAALANEAGDWD